MVQRRNKLVRIQWEVPAAPPAGDYYPTPQAITEKEFENHVKQQEEKDQARDGAGEQQPAGPAEESSPGPEDQPEKGSAA